jgi:diketogulonate reductase-like aldo/keto reductase
MRDERDTDVLDDYDEYPISRRTAVRLMAAGTAGVLLGCGASGETVRQSMPFEKSITAEQTMHTRPVPSSGEILPLIGLGTWQTFDKGASAEERNPLEEVLSRFVKLGGRVVDSSPMYGRSEQVVGEIAAKLDLHRSLFIATKVWTTGKRGGIEQMEESQRLLRAKRLDLMQVHNLVDIATHLGTLREWKSEGRIRYLGITHYSLSGYAEVERLIQDEKLDFLQINYSLLEPEAESRLLPLAADGGVAVIVNRPLGGGALFGRVRGRQLPEWASEFDCRSWAQFFLKWVVAHSSVTCAIPATDNIRHLEDNMGTGSGRLPDAKLRRRMMDFITSL